jgi:hypothetical protein
MQFNRLFLPRQSAQTANPDTPGTSLARKSPQADPLLNAQSTRLIQRFPGSPRIAPRPSIECCLDHSTGKSVGRAIRCHIGPEFAQPIDSRIRRIARDDRRVDYWWRLGSNAGSVGRKAEQQLPNHYGSAAKFESSRPHHAVSRKQRFPDSSKERALDGGNEGPLGSISW